MISIDFLHWKQQKSMKTVFYIFFSNLQSMHRFWHHCLLFITKYEIIDENLWNLWHWLHLMTLFAFLTKKILISLFFPENYLLEQLLSFLFQKEHLNQCKSKKSQPYHKDRITSQCSIINCSLDGLNILY